MPQATSTVANFFAGSFDVPLFVILAASISLMSFSGGSARATALSLSIPISYIFYSWIPQTAVLQTAAGYAHSPALQAAILACLLIIFYYLLQAVMYSYAEYGGSVVQAVFQGIATTILLVLFWIQLPALSELWSFSPLFQTVFGEAYRAWWVLVSVVLLAISHW